MAGSPPLRSSSFVGGFVKSEHAVTSAIRSAKSSDFESRRLVVPNVQELLSKDERKAAQFAVKIRRVSFVRVQISKPSKQGPWFFVLSFPLFRLSRSDNLPRSRYFACGGRRRRGAVICTVYCTRAPGDVAQLGEHLLCKQGVSGSIPLSSTITSRLACSICKASDVCLRLSLRGRWRLNLEQECSSRLRARSDNVAIRFAQRFLTTE